MVKLNNEKFIAVLNQLGMIVPSDAEVSVIDNISEGHVIASVRGHQFKVRGDTWERFVARVDTNSHMEIYEMLQSRFSGLEYIPVLEDHEDDIPTVTKDATELPFEYREMIHQRLSSIVGVVGSRISNIATAVNTRTDAVAKDVNFIKDFDGMFSFDIPEEERFKMVMCFDKIPPITAIGETIEILRTPMTTEFKLAFFGPEALKVVEKEIKEIEDVVNAFLDSKLVNSSELAKKYVMGMFAGAVTNCIMNITPTVVMFGGTDNWRLFGDSTPNTIACRKFLEPEVQHVIDTLKAIPLKDNVVVYSLDLSKMGIYGRDVNNKVVTCLLLDVTNDLTSRWSDGFLDMMRIRLAQNDSPHLFYYH